MRSPRFFGKPKKPKLLVRRVTGDSMLPTLKAGQIVVATGQLRRVRPGQIIIVRHGGLEKIKRVSQIDEMRGVFVLGDNAVQSTDSRSFGWLNFNEIIGRVIWPRG